MPMLVGTAWVGAEDWLRGLVDDVSFQFCATRKGTQQAAATLVKDARFVMNSEHKQRLINSWLL